VHRVRLATLKLARHFRRLMTGVAPYAAAASAALILWQAASTPWLAALSVPQTPAKTASAQVPAPTASVSAAAQNPSDAPSRIGVN
jgi:hypothetical protein